MGNIITFYSYKGGVGRTMALANVAVILSLWKYKVLVVDWDLEAPGLEFLFKDYLSLEEAFQRKGVIELLCDFSSTEQLTSSQKWQTFCLELQVSKNATPLHFISAGKRDAKYFGKVIGLDVKKFYDRDGGSFIESLRDEWKQEYDFVLIDSRTGITDLGGICTIQLPDILVLLSTATEQSLKGSLELAKNINPARQKLFLNRDIILSLPILSRIDTRDELERSQNWIERFGREFAEIYDYWLPNSINERDLFVRDFVNQTKIPYGAYFSFGEELAVIKDGIKNPQGLGLAYETLSALIANKLKYSENLIYNRNEFIISAHNNDFKSEELIQKHQPVIHNESSLIESQIDYIINGNVSKINVYYGNSKDLTTLKTQKNILFDRLSYSIQEQILNDPQLKKDVKIFLKELVQTQDYSLVLELVLGVSERLLPISQYKEIRDIAYDILFEHAKQNNFHIYELLETLKVCLPEPEQKVENYSLSNQYALKFIIEYAITTINNFKTVDYGVWPSKYPLFANLKDDNGLAQIDSLISWIFHPGIEYVLENLGNETYNQSSQFTKELLEDNSIDDASNLKTINIVLADLVEIWFKVLYGFQTTNLHPEVLAISDRLLRQIVLHTNHSQQRELVRRWWARQAFFINEIRNIGIAERTKRQQLRNERKVILELHNKFKVLAKD